MKRHQIAVPWKEGLHLRPAARLVKCAKAFQSSIFLKANNRLADARSILAVLLLCASFGSVLDLEVFGADEDEAMAAIAAVFEPAGTGESEAGTETGTQEPAA